MCVTKKLTVPIDLYGGRGDTLEVNGYVNFLVTNILQNINDDRILISGWTIPLNSLAWQPSYHHTKHEVT